MRGALTRKLVPPLHQAFFPLSLFSRSIFSSFSLSPASYKPSLPPLYFFFLFPFVRGARARTSLPLPLRFSVSLLLSFSASISDSATLHPPPPLPPPCGMIGFQESKIRRESAKVLCPVVFKLPDQFVESSSSVDSVLLKLLVRLLRIIAFGGKLHTDAVRMGIPSTKVRTCVERHRHLSNARGRTFSRAA